MINPVEILFPKCCPGCDEALSLKYYSRGFCKKCASGLKFTTDSVCVKCGRRLGDETQELCRDCAKSVHHFIQHKSVYAYDGVMKPAMYRFKYGNRRAYARTFAGHAEAKYEKWIKNIKPEVIVAVPMYGPKKRKRGYNQAEVFARELSKVTGIPYAKDIIARTRDTAPMKSVDSSTRKYNLQNAFKLKNNGVKFNKILLVDDIYTSGSTMDGVSQVLKAAGVSKIYCLSICIGDNSREV